MYVSVCYINETAYYDFIDQSDLDFCINSLYS